MLGTPLGRILLDRPAWTYLLGPFFKASTPDTAAPLSATYREAGAVGALTVTDVDNTFTTVGGQLRCAGKGAGAAPAQVSEASYARVAGLTLALSPDFTGGIADNRFGWLSGTDPSAHRLYGFRNDGAQWIININGTTELALGVAPAIAKNRAWLVLRTAGCLYLTQTATGQATLRWVANAGTTTPLYACVAWAPTAAVSNRANALAVTLPGAFASDYGLATDRKATSAATDTITHTANGLVEHTITAATGVTQELWVRRTDASNGWIVRMSQAGSTIKLIELVAGVETERASTAQTWTNGVAYRVVVICDGTTITPYVANVAKTGYASASTNQSATTAYVDTAGSELIAWPRTVALPQGV